MQFTAMYLQKQLSAPLDAFDNCCRLLRVGDHQQPAQQSAFLREYLTIVNQLKQTASTQLPVPVVDTNDIKVSIYLLKQFRLLEDRNTLACSATQYWATYKFFEIIDLSVCLIQEFIRVSGLAKNLNVS